MKKLLATIVLALLCTTLSAQRYEVGPRHEIRLGTGVAPLSTLGHYAFRGSVDYNPLYGPVSYYDTGGNYNSRKLSASPRYDTPSAIVAYTYRAKRWCEVGLTFAYAASYSYTDDFSTGKVAYRDRDNLFMFVPTVRFVWFRRDYVRMYSSIGMGFGYVLHNTKNYSNGLSRLTQNTIFSGSIVPFGIAVGGKVFGFLELGPSSYGILNLGIGIRLNDHKKAPEL